METIRIPLLFSDTTLGTLEFGLIPRTLGADSDDEDLQDEEDRKYERHIRSTRPDLKARVVEGVVHISRR